jgi:hypothetical protein
MGGQTFDIGTFADIKTLRDFLAATKKDFTAAWGPITGVKEEKDRQITVRDGEKIAVRTYTPENTGGPLYLMIHGGGWCIGNLESEDLLCRLLCGKLGFVVVSVDYRLAPEHKYPTAHNDCWDAFKWVSLWVVTSQQKRLLTSVGCRKCFAARCRSKQRIHHWRQFSRRQPRHNHFPFGSR